LHPDDRETELEAHDRLSRTGEPWSREYRLIASDGLEVWVRDQARLIRDADGRAVAWQGVLLDITPQKEAEAQLHEANERLEMRVLERTAALEEANALMALEIAERRRAEAHLRDAEERARILIEEIPAAPYRWQVWARTPDDWTEMYVSPAIERILGYTPSEWNNAGELWRSRVHPHDRERVTAAAERSTRTGEPYEVEARYLARDGRVVWVLDRATLLRRNERGEPWVFQGVMVDVTERKEAEQQAHDAERRFSAIIEKGPDVTYSYTREHGNDGSTLRVDYVSPQMARLLGYDEPWWIDRPEEWFDMIHPDDRERVESTVRDVWSTGARWDMEYRMLRADGSIAWFHDRGRCVGRDERGLPMQFLGSISEVTAQTEERIGLEQERDRYKELVQSIPAVVWTETVDEEGRSRYTYISPNVVRFLGYTAEELMAERRHFARLVHPADAERVRAGGEAADAEGLTHWEDEYRVRHRDGSVRWLRARARRATPPGETPAVWHGVTVDVTAQHGSAATSVEASTDVAAE
jgi:PAS domain S-box-containing protein